VRFGALSGAATALACGVFLGSIVVMGGGAIGGPRLSDVIGRTVVGVIVCAGVGAVAGLLLGALIESFLALVRTADLLPKHTPPQAPLTIPPDVEAIARERFNVPGDAGPRDEVKRAGEVRPGE